MMHGGPCPRAYPEQPFWRLQFGLSRFSPGRRLAGHGEMFWVSHGFLRKLVASSLALIDSIAEAGDSWVVFHFSGG